MYLFLFCEFSPLFAFLTAFGLFLGLFSIKFAEVSALRGLWGREGVIFLQQGCTVSNLKQKLLVHGMVVSRQWQTGAIAGSAYVYSAVKNRGRY